MNKKSSPDSGTGADPWEVKETTELPATGSGTKGILQYAFDRSPVNAWLRDDVYPMSEEEREEWIKKHNQQQRLAYDVDHRLSKLDDWISDILERAGFNSDWESVFKNRSYFHDEQEQALATPEFKRNALANDIKLDLHQLRQAYDANDLDGSLNLSINITHYVRLLTIAFYEREIVAGTKRSSQERVISEQQRMEIVADVRAWYQGRERKPRHNEIYDYILKNHSPAKETTVKKYFKLLADQLVASDKQ